MNKRVLIVEPDFLTLDSLTKVISLYNYEVVQVSSGNKAIRLLNIDSDFALIIVDHDMKDGDGISVIEYTKKQNLQMPLILMTTKSDKQLAIKMLNFRIFGLVEKPLNFETVSNLVMSAIISKQEKDKTRTLVEIGRNSANTLEFIKQIETEVSNLQEKSKKIKQPELSRIIDNLNLTTKKIKDTITQSKVIIKQEKIQLQAIIAKVQALTIPDSVKRQVPLILPLNNFELIGNKEELINTLTFLINNSVEFVSVLENRWVKLEAYKDFSGVKLILTDSSNFKSKLNQFESLDENIKTICNAKKTLVRAKAIELILSGASGLKLAFERELTETRIVLSLELML